MKWGAVMSVSLTQEPIATFCDSLSTGVEALKMKVRSTVSAVAGVCLFALPMATSVQASQPYTGCVFSLPHPTLPSSFLSYDLSAMAGTKSTSKSLSFVWPLYLAPNPH